MATYHGGKQRIGKKISEIIYENVMNQNKMFPEGTSRREIKVDTYIEPFCGMLGVYRWMPSKFGDKFTYFAGDINKSIILMWKKIQEGWEPPISCSEERFKKLKYDGKYSAIEGYVGHLCTYRGVFFDSYYQQKSSKMETNRKRTLEIGKQIGNVTFTSDSYKQFSNVKNAVIYTDPPYWGGEQRYYEGKEYKNRLVFDNEEFFNWCRQMSKHNLIFISEYSAPPDFILLASFGPKEKLFTI
jgi:DNA adenine methylase